MIHEIFPSQVQHHRSAVADTVALSSSQGRLHQLVAQTVWTGHQHTAAISSANYRLRRLASEPVWSPSSTLHWAAFATAVREHLWRLGFRNNSAHCSNCDAAAASRQTEYQRVLNDWAIAYSTTVPTTTGILFWPNKPSSVRPRNATLPLTPMQASLAM